MKDCSSPGSLDMSAIERLKHFKAYVSEEQRQSILTHTNSEHAANVIAELVLYLVMKVWSLTGTVENNDVTIDSEIYRGDDLQVKVNEHEEEIEKLNEKIATLEEKVETLTEANKKLHADNQKLNEENTKLNEKIAKLEEKMDMILSGHLGHTLRHGYVEHKRFR